MVQQSSATGRRRIALRARRLIAALARAWREGVYVSELMLEGPWDHEGPLRWRRGAHGWVLHGAQLPLSPPSGDVSLPPSADDPPVSRRPGPASC